VKKPAKKNKAKAVKKTSKKKLPEKEGYGLPLLWQRKPTKLRAELKRRRQAKKDAA
jgi:hypothetical protein